MRLPLICQILSNMKGTGSKDKGSTVASSQNKLHKTQVPPKQTQIMENTYYAQKTNLPENGKPTASQMPPRAASSQKITYNVQQNMTISKIMVAKQGLQLLKKKMSRNMSREKTSVQKKEEVQQPVSKKNIYKPPQDEDYEPPRDSKKPTPKLNSKQLPPEPPKKSPAPSSKTIEDQPIRKQPVSNQFINDLQEAPLKSNQDFMAILQREMAKEKNNMPLAPTKAVAAKKVEQFVEEEEIELVPCSKGCGRQFNPNVLPKHEKVCEKVFQSKRKAFNSAEFRKPDSEEGIIKAPPPPPEPPKAVSKKADKIPKWKKDSAAFRAGIKAGRGQALTQEQKMLSGQDDMIQCPCCGRKFNETAGKRHIAFCTSKSKEMPKMNTSKKK